MRASSLSTFSVPVTPYDLLGTPGNLELRKRTGVSGPTVNNVDLAGLVGDVDASLPCDTSGHDVLCTDRIRRSLRRDLRAYLLGDFAVLLHLRDLGAGREKLFILCLVEFHDK